MSYQKHTLEKTGRPNDNEAIIHRLRSIDRPLSAADGIFFAMLLSSDTFSTDIDDHDGDLYVRMQAPDTKELVTDSTSHLFQAMVDCALTSAEVLSGTIPLKDMNPAMPIPDVFSSHRDDVSDRVNEQLNELRREYEAAGSMVTNAEQIIN